MERFIKRMAVIIYIILAFLHPLPVIMTTSVPCHSEWTQECFVGMKGNDDVMRSDEFVTLVTLQVLLSPSWV